jgi:hypothetical protein
LQRNALISPPHVFDVDGCLLCYSWKGRLATTQTMCNECIGLHARQEEGLIRLQFFVKEAFGRDIGGIMMRRLVRM